MVHLTTEAGYSGVAQEIVEGNCLITQATIQEFDSRAPILGRFLDQYVFQACPAETTTLLRAILDKANAAYTQTVSTQVSAGTALTHLLYLLPFVLALVFVWTTCHILPYSFPY